MCRSNLKRWCCMSVKSFILQRAMLRSTMKLVKWICYLCCNDLESLIVNTRRPNFRNETKRNLKSFKDDPSVRTRKIIQSKWFFSFLNIHPDLFITMLKQSWNHKTKMNPAYMIFKIIHSSLIDFEGLDEFSHLTKANDIMRSWSRKILGIQSSRGQSANRRQPCFIIILAWFLRVTYFCYCIT